jgi:hypothetical protein
MKILFTTLVSISSFWAIMHAQTWQTLGTGFMLSGEIASNLQVLSYQDTGFVAYADMNTVFVKKRSGNSWTTVGSYTTENNYFKLIYGHDNKPLFVTLSRGQADVGTTGFYADIHLYENGAMVLLESKLLEFVADSDVSNLQVSNFDFTANSDGNMACIIRFPSSARSVYNAKIGNNPWYTETVFYGAIGGASGNAIERSKLSFNNKGVTIVSKLFNQSLGSAHIFLHSTTSSTPISSHVNSGAFSVGSGVDPIKITSKGDTTYAVIPDQNSNEILWKFYHDASNEPLSLSQILNYGSNFPNVVPHFTETENYISYFEPDFSSTGYVATVSDDYTIASASNFGTTFTLGETVVAPSVYSVNPENGDIYVAYIFGPPMTNSILRKFGCASATASYNTNSNTLSLSSTHGSTATYAWTLCNETNVLSTSATFEPENNGEYQVTVTEGECEVTSACVSVEIEDTGVGIENESQNSINIYPNPADDHFTISGIQEVSEVSIYDITGGIIWKETLSNETNIVNISSWYSGVYFVNIASKTGNRTQKIVKR